MTDATPEQLFRLEEFKSLKSEILQKMSDQKSLQKNTVVSLAILYSVAATLSRYPVDPKIKNIEWIIWWVPFGIASLAAAFSYVDDRMIRLAGQYLERVELRHGPGWETFLSKNKRSSLGFWVQLPRLIWNLVIGIAFVIAACETPWSSFSRPFSHS